MVKVFLRSYTPESTVTQCQAASSPCRRPLGAPALMPAGAVAADYVPDQVIVKYAEGVGGGVAANVAADAGAAPVAGLPGGSEQLQIEDGQSVPATIAELRQDPNVDYAVPNWKAHAAAVAPNDPGWRLQWNLSGPLRDQRGRRLDRGGRARRPRGARRGRRRARQRSGVRALRALPAGTRPAPQHLHPPVGLHRARPPPERRRWPRHARGGDDRSDTNNGIGIAGIAYNAKIMPLRVLDSRGEGDSAAIARAIRYAVRTAPT